MLPIRNRDAYSIKTWNALQTETSISSTPRVVSDTQASFVGFLFHNNDASARWVQVFFRSASQVTLGTTPPDFTILIAASGSVAWDFYNPIRQGTGLSLAATTTETGTTAPTAGVTGVIYYKN